MFWMVGVATQNKISKKMLRATPFQKIFSLRDTEKTSKEGRGER